MAELSRGVDDATGFRECDFGRTLARRLSLKRAAEMGYDCVELMCWPQGTMPNADMLASPTWT
jgi:hypothetical protein